MSTKETAKQRRERERLEAQEAERIFNAGKADRLMHAMARARDLDVEAYFYYRYDQVLYYSFSFPDGDLMTDPVAELGAYTMDAIEQNLDDIQRKVDRERHLDRVKQDLLLRLSDDEREALGITNSSW